MIENQCHFQTNLFGFFLHFLGIKVYVSILRGLIFLQTLFSTQLLTSNFNRTLNIHLVDEYLLFEKSLF